MSNLKQYQKMPVFNIKKGPIVPCKPESTTVLLNFHNEMDLDWLVRNKPRMIKMILITDMKISSIDVATFENSKLIEIKKQIDDQTVQRFINLLLGGEENSVVDLSKYNQSQMKLMLKTLYKL
ncbi:hypothetical protein ACP2X5_07450 [Leuconostoc mesenteroides subsp. jonggajibkimchii]|uniref:hypothetical protein n=1 Tax=Leuconostoc mesenteroides TaxID=1245 RepID=UPI003CEDAECD